MNGWLGDATDWLRVRQEQAELSTPLTYSGVLRHLFWNGLHGVPGLVLIIGSQLLLNGIDAVVVYAAGTGLVGSGILTTVASLRDDRLGLVGFPLAGLGIAGLLFQWTGQRGIGGWLVLFLSFVTLLVSLTTYATLQPKRTSSQ